MEWLHSQLTQPYCGALYDPDGPDGPLPPTSVSVNPCPVYDTETNTTVYVTPEAAKGTQLPVAPDFKGNLTSRYQFSIGSFDAHVQGALVYVGVRETDLRKFENDIVGSLPAYTLVNFTAGVGRGDWKAELYVNNAFDQYAEYSRYTECGESKCGQQSYSVVAPPRQVGVQFSQGFGSKK